MKIIYQADDGKTFETEYECLGYENGLKFPELFSIVFFDAEGKSYFINENHIYNDDVYQKAERVYIHSAAELSAFHWLAEECGWCEFEDITEPGIWERKETNKIWHEGEWKIKKNHNIKTSCE